MSQGTDWDAVRLAPPGMSSESLLELVEKWILMSEEILRDTNAPSRVTPQVRFDMSMTQYRWTVQKEILVRLWETATAREWPTK